MPRNSSRPQRRGNANEFEETDLTASEEWLPGWDGTIDPRLLSTAGFPASTTDGAYYAPPFPSASHYPNYHSTAFNTEEDIQEYAATTPDVANYTYSSSAARFDAVAGENLDFDSDNSGFDASGIEIDHNNSLESTTTQHSES